MKLLKNLIRYALNRAGYVVMRRSIYDDLTKAGPISSSRSLNAQRLEVEARRARAREMGYGEDFDRFLDRACPVFAPTLELAHAVFGAASAMHKAKIVGDVVECRNGLSEILATAGAALNFAGDVEHRLLLIDISGDPTLRPEPDMALWGVDGDLIGQCTRTGRVAPRDDPRLWPKPLQQIFYPADRIRVIRGRAEILDTADVSPQIAFLVLSADSYLENRHAIANLLPRLATGGTLVVHRRPMALTTSDSVAELILALKLPITLRDLGSGFSIGVRER